MCERSYSGCADIGSCRELRHIVRFVACPQTGVNVISFPFLPVKMELLQSFCALKRNSSSLRVETQT